MKCLQVKPAIHVFDHFQQFAEEFQVGEGDYVLTNEFIYEPFMKALNLKATFVFQEKYGAGEPSDEMMNAILADMPGGVKRIVAIGGGTILDIAKLLIFKDVTDVNKLFERAVPLTRARELILVPTTCGTGSEVTNISIAELKAKKTKMGLADDALLADSAVLIPELIRGLPFRFFVASAIDALIHGIESFVSPKSNSFTELFSVKAINMLLDGFKEIAEKGEERRFDLLKQFALASTYAGVAFANTGVGAVHAMSYPLGGVYHVPHGEANYAMFTGVFGLYNKRNPNGKIKEINELLAQKLDTTPDKVYVEIEVLLNKLLQKKALSEYGMKREEIEQFTESVISGQQRLLNNNYVPFERQDFIDIYTGLYE